MMTRSGNLKIEDFKKLLKETEENIRSNLKDEMEKIFNAKVNSISSNKEMVESLKLEVFTIKNEIEEIKRSQQYISEKFEESKQSSTEMKRNCDSIQANMDSTNRDMDYLFQKLDDIEQYGRRDNLEFHGAFENY